MIALIIQKSGKIQELIENDSNDNENILTVHVSKVISKIEIQYKIELAKIELVGIGIGHDVGQFYKNSIVIKNPDELSNVKIINCFEGRGGFDSNVKEGVNRPLPGAFKARGACCSFVLVYFLLRNSAIFCLIVPISTAPGISSSPITNPGVPLIPIVPPSS